LNKRAMWGIVAPTPMCRPTSQRCRQYPSSLSHLEHRHTMLTIARRNATENRKAGFFFLGPNLLRRAPRSLLLMNKKQRCDTTLCISALLETCYVSVMDTWFLLNTRLFLRPRCSQLPSACSLAAAVGISYASIFVNFEKFPWYKRLLQKKIHANAGCESRGCVVIIRPVVKSLSP
jgi:hypothetical protein